MSKWHCIPIAAFAYATVAHAAKYAVVSETSFGPITKTTTANLATLKKLFPKYTVKSEPTSSEGEVTGESLMVFDGKDHLFNVYTTKASPNKIFSIEIFSPAYQTPDGFSVGTSVDTLIGSKKGLRCFRGLEEKSDTAICHLGQQKHLDYTFNTSLNDIDVGPENALNVSKGYDRKVLSLVWRP